MGLTRKIARFVDEYLKDLNGKQAAIRAGYSPKTAEVQASRLLSNAKVQAAVVVQMKKREQRTEITQDRVLQEYARIAFLDPRKLLDNTGRPLPMQELDEDTARAIAGLKVSDKYTPATEEGGAPDISTVIEYKLVDKKGALDSVARHLGMFNDKLNLNVTDALADRLSRAKSRE
jgi:phage terminase small subunit